MPDHAPLPAWHPSLTDTEASAEARRIIADAYRPAPQMPTAYRDETPLPTYGSTPPVLQPDRRIVPAWAAGTAVAGIGVGATCVGAGCGIWLACQGFAAVILTSVLFITLPLAAVAALAAAIGSAIRSVKATRSETHHHYSGPVRQETNTITAPAYGLIARNRNELHR
ncbi:hypothetical protein GCM10010260_49320 [Streptomyces filipinensis]|uniref:Uncharacterized protein n=1 Tax=Streptomyces filipinensis TaxID=66887 RepID=A0A918IEC4_9ACTN|nr:hypothetical protein [Streptomyces filipinensis]GGV06015.1 hypothetical protein GCM10010260_49320 [Streptomyces filipinensis]